MLSHYLLGMGSLFYILAKAIYRLHFHPLSKFPGPKLAAITSLYDFLFFGYKGWSFHMGD